MLRPLAQPYFLLLANRRPVEKCALLHVTRICENTQNFQTREPNLFPADESWNTRPQTVFERNIYSPVCTDS